MVILRGYGARHRRWRCSPDDLESARGRPGTGPPWADSPDEWRNAVPVTDGERYVVVGSNSGLPDQPAWLANVAANPVVTVEVGPETFQARATINRDDERERL
ncbi:MAG TPA: nitroreductase/quinone reductase family protein [Candidatus Limnocylindrales bacterium]